MSNDLADTILRGFLRREPSGEDYKRIDQLAAALPHEMQDSPAVMADVILRAATLRRMEELVQTATFEAQQRIHRDLPERVDDAATQALRHIRDKLPVDSADRFGRLLKIGTIWTVMVVTVGLTAGWIGANRSNDRYHMAHQAATDSQFNRCVDAAIGAAAGVTDKSGGGARYDPAVFRDYARSCAAEYADRRAGAG